MNLKRKFNFQVSALEAGQRIDRFLVEKLKDDFSRSEIKKFIDTGYVQLNAHTVKAHQKVMFIE